MTWIKKNVNKRLLHLWYYCYTQGSFPAGTPGNGVPKVILTMGTAFPGTHTALGELYKKHTVCTKIRLFEIPNRFFSGKGANREGDTPPHTLRPRHLRRSNSLVPPFANPGASTVLFPHFFSRKRSLVTLLYYISHIESVADPGFAKREVGP